MEPALILGQAAALGSAASWALGNVLFGRLGRAVSPLGMNLFKGLVGLVGLGLALAVLGLEPQTGRDLALLGLSGLVGIALGDTLFFASLVRLGPLPVVLLGTLGPVLTVLGSVALLGERPEAAAWAGSGLVLGGVLLVLWPEAGAGAWRASAAGVLYGLGASLCMTAGILLGKLGVAEVGALQGTFVRLGWAVAGLLLWGGATREIGSWLAPFREGRVLLLGLVAAAVVVLGGFWLSLLALKNLPASQATVLNSTEPLFLLPLGALVLGQRVRPREVLGAAAAVGGIALLTLS